jgi:two-component system nitrogen regulation response regulator GlnG
MPPEHDETLPSGHVPQGLLRTRRMLAATVAYHPDLSRVGDRAVLGPIGAVDVEISRTEPELFAAGRVDGAPLSDRTVSRRGVRVTSERGGGLRLEAGAPLHVAGRSIDGAVHLTDADVLRGAVLRLGRVVLVLHALESVRRGGEDYAMVGRSGAVDAVRDLVDRVAGEEVPVLVRGESGVGKELVARAIHAHSARRSGPFVALNMASLPAGTAAAELFGHHRGGYTGAVGEHEGAFGAAHGGTLFLDEIGAADAQVQGMLLRALELGEVRSVGGRSTRRVDVRVVSATDGDLERCVEEGTFRLPLLHRLAGFEIFVPPLRDRREDIGVLFVHFLRSALGSDATLLCREPPWLGAALVERLLLHDWPGNLRQLRNVASQIAIANRGRDEAAMPDAVARMLEGGRTERREGAATVPPRAAPPRAVRERLDDLEEAAVLDALAQNDFEPTAAARALGIAKSSIYELMQRLDVRTAASLTREEIVRARAACGADVRRMAVELRVSRRGLRRRMTELGIDE